MKYAQEDRKTPNNQLKEGTVDPDKSPAKDQAEESANFTFVLEGNYPLLKAKELVRRQNLAGDKEFHEVETEQLCQYWNSGLDCASLMKGAPCPKRHICSHQDCRFFTLTDHRAIQHPPERTCKKHE